MAENQEGPAKKPAPRSPARRVHAEKQSPQQQQQAATEPVNMSSNITPNVWAKYSNIVENTLGLGRNGKRLAHGALAAGGTYAAGTYGGIEAINNNLPVALGGAAVGGVVGTAIVDHLALDADQQAWLMKQALLSQREEVRGKYPAMAEELMGELSKGKKAANG